MALKLLVVPLSLLLIVFLIRVLRIGRRPKDIPPGPPTLPIIGNIHQMPTRDLHKQLYKWAQVYGPVYSLILGTQTLIVLTSDQAVKDLLDKRSAIYSDRMDMYIGMKLCSGDLRLLMMRYGPRWRMVRKLAHSLLNINVARSYVPYQMLENKQMLFELLTQPKDFLHHVRRYSNSLTTSMVFGWRAPTYNNPDVQQLFDGFEEFAVVSQTGTASVLDSYPSLRILPDWLLPMQRYAKELHVREKELYLRHWLNCKKSIVEGTARPCFCATMASMQKVEGFSDELAAYISGTFLEAGSDTTSSTLYGFVLAMVLFPEVQKRAQEEIDSVVGDSRLPTMEDEPKMQYIRGCVKESLRWMPVTPLGAVPHAVTQDDYYMGYRIPAGAGVINNVWGIHRDERRYPDPRRFDPDRFKDDYQTAYDAAVNSDVSQRDHFTFGAGRRICAGTHVAERSLFLGVSRMLWAFDIKPEIDEQGNFILPDQDRMTQGFVAMPEEYQCRIIPRSEKQALLVQKEWEDIQELLDPTTKQWKAIPEGMGRKV
ncbi:hypothetical protein DTO166G4_7308 [Paecilomyces variotii]|nr:hypothetical protein DTO032I3_3556 [Paecilomyces variotii]KAJ9211092.1 hypothetical protein DTO166G4_7308 [Paecilomyces variotii]KAJ9275867.1 hypothetical protein DTO021D3_7276 [Paecilomyces variotii]KAJ9340698.1 hypothetical protein DTO027B6_6760 [Paecilomyces variotii]KAJ9376839.1 hypothetical protein DTO032I4_8379 [Paecilomyces variotii]